MPSPKCQTGRQLSKSRFKPEKELIGVPSALQPSQNKTQMKRNLLFPGVRKALLAVPAAAMMLGAASHGAEIGINFQDNWGGTPYAPLNDAAGAFGIPLANWYNAPSVFNSGPGAGVGTNGTFAVPGGGD